MAISPYIIPGVDIKRLLPFNIHHTLKGIVCRIFSVEEKEIFSKTRKRPIVTARQAFVTALWELEHWGPSKIGREISLNHATALHCRKVVSNLIDTDREFRARFAQVIAEYRMEVQKHRADTERAARLLGLLPPESENSPSEARSLPGAYTDTTEEEKLIHALTLVA
jgi:hypothetical protein